MIADHILPPDTQAILLLCGYFGNNSHQGAKPLTLSEYNTLAAQLRKEGLRPADMLEDEGEKQIEKICSGKIAPDRLRALLDRGVEMGFAVEEWTKQGIWVISRGDASYPRALKSRLREAAPALLFGVGDQGLLKSGGLGVVGSRDADETALLFTREIARRCAEEHLTIVSGGAKGIDREAMRAALTAGGYVLGILPEGIAKVAVSKANREPIAEGRLTLVSPYHPNARWTSGNAMGRNKHIYAFSDWTLVVSSDTKGGTWSGAVESLKKGWGRLLVRAADAPKGNTKLIQLGGVPLEPETVARAESLDKLLNSLFQPNKAVGDGAPTLFSALEDARSSYTPAETDGASPSVAEPKWDATEKDTTSTGRDASKRSLSNLPQRKTTSPEIGDLFSVVWPSLALAFDEERPNEELADLAATFNVQVGQLKAWVKQAVEKEYLEKRARPVRYLLNYHHRK